MGRGKDNNDDQDTSMKDLQESLLEVESETGEITRKTSGAQITSIPKVLYGLTTHKSGGNQKKALAGAVVEALTAVIIEKNGDTIPTAYLGLILSSLSPTTDENELDVLLFLLKLIVPEINSSIFISKFDQIISTLVSLLQNKYEAIHIVINTLLIINMLIKHVASTLTVKSWAKKAKLVALYQSLLALSIDPRPKVRKEAHHCLESMFAHESGSLAAKQAGKITTKFFITQVNTAKTETEKKNVSYVFSAFTPILPYFPLSISNEILDVTLNQMKANTGIIRKQGYDLFTHLFTFRPTPLNQNVLSRLLPELEKVQPQGLETEYVQSYGKMIAAATILLHELDPIICAGQLATIIKLLMEIIPTTKADGYEPICSAIESILNACIDQSVLLVEAQNQTETSNLFQINAQLRQGLSYQYQPAWGFILTLFAIFYGRLNDQCAPAIVSSLQSIEQFAKDSHSRHQQAALQAYSAAIQAIGPHNFLRVLPLNLDHNITADDRREYLLPLLQKSVSHAPLAFFGSYFIAQANLLKTQIAQAEEKHDDVLAKNLKILYSQIWDLLPAFCNVPTDVTENFGKLARILGSLLSDDEQLRLTVCQSLHTLISSNYKLAHPTKKVFQLQDEEDEDDVASSSHKNTVHTAHTSRVTITEEKAKANLVEIAKFSKNFLPILFNFYCSMDQSPKLIRLRTSIYTTISDFIQISDKQIVDTFFNSVLKKILEANGTSKSEKTNRALLTELAQAFVDALDNTQLEMLFKVIQPQLQDVDAKIQKKSYKVLERLCCNETYLTAHLEQLKQILIGSLSTSKAVSKHNRLRCLRYVTLALPGDPVEQLFSSSDESVSSSEVLAEIIACVKELNKSARNEAYKLLTCICDRSIDYYSDNSSFIQLVLAGLAGTTSHMISATVLALTHLVHHLNEQLDEEFVESLYQTILILFTTKNREIIKSCLGFVKTMTTVLSVEKLTQNMKATIDHVFLWINESKNRFRLKIKVILERWIRKLGYETMQSFVPPEHHKLLAAIRKQIKRNKESNKEHDERDDSDKKNDQKKPGKQQEKNKKKMESDDDDSENDMESDDEFLNRFESNVGDKLASEEDEDEEIVDLLDPNASKLLARKLHQTKSKKVTKTDTKNFKTDQNSGKMIFMEEDDDEEEENDKANAKKKSMYDSLKSGGPRERSAKRKRSALTEVDDEDDGVGQGSSKRRKTNNHPENTSVNRYSGSEFKSKKGTGDRKVKGKHEPFAYMPMNPQLLNKRKQQKAKKQVANIVSSAQKGATKGKKSRRRD